MDNTILGFEFDNNESYDLAKRELEYVTKIKEKNVLANPKNTLEIYNKIINDGIFKTPVGMEYLRGLQKELYANKAVDNSLIRSIPAIVNNKKNTAKIENDNLNKKANKSFDKKLLKEKNKYKDLYIKMLIMNFVLVITIAIMFIITKKADKFDANSYRESIEDSYMSWQNDLKERESSINAKENEEQFTK